MADQREKPKSKAFSWPPQGPAQLAAIGTAFQGIANGCSFQPVTMTLLCLPPGNGYDIDPNRLPPKAGPDYYPLVNAAVEGGMTVQVAALQEAGGPYTRRFNLAPYRGVQLDISTFIDVRVDLLRTTLVRGTLWAIVTNREAATTIENTALYAEEYVAMGTYLVPEGADRLYPAVADVGFNWRSWSYFDPALLPGTTSDVLIADPALVAAQLEVKGTHFVTSIPSFQALWRIRL